MSLLKYFVAVFLLISLGACSTDTNEPENIIPEMEMPQEEEEDMSNDEIIFQGDVLLTNQNEVDTFGSNNYTSISGSLSIAYDNENPSGPEITNLTPLNTLVTIGDFLLLDRLNSIENLNGLESIQEINSSVLINGSTSIKNIDGIAQANFNRLVVQSLSALETFPAFDQITSLSSLALTNISLESLNTLNNLEEVSNTFTISSNSSLQSIEGFQNLEKINGIFIFSGLLALESVTGFNNLNEINNDITLSANLMSNIDFLQNIQTASDIRIEDYFFGSELNLSGLQNLTSCNSLSIVNSNILSLEGLNSFSSTTSLEISSCSNLTTLNGIESLVPLTTDPNSLISFIVKENENLTDFCGATNFITTPINNSFNYFVEFNAFNPTGSDFASGNCSM